MNKEQSAEQPSTSSAARKGHKPGTKPGTKIRSGNRTSVYKSLFSRTVSLPEDTGRITKHVSRVIQDSKDCAGDVAEVKLTQRDERLVQILYPGVVESPANAVRTLGGIAKISEAFENSSKKLEIRFRPENPFSNPICGSGRTTVGLLLRIRKKKTGNKAEPEAKRPPDLLDLDELEANPDLLEEAKKKLLSGDKSQPKKNLKPGSTLFEDEKDEEQFRSAIGSKQLLEDEKNSIVGTKMVIRLPHPDFRPAKSKLEIEPCGIVNKAYDSFGVGDFQYLPTMLNEEGKHESILENIFPGFGDPDNNILFDFEECNEPGEKKYQPFIVPPVMSRIDKTIVNISKTYVTNPTEPDSEYIIKDGTVENLRAKRSVYTHMLCFPWTDEPELEDQFKVPNKPFDEALREARKKFCGTSNIETVRRKFDERPMWTKLALQRETDISYEHLKYLLPCAAYFCLNGPWRGLWTRFGYDPRKETNAFLYQLIDYRVPADYKHLVDLDGGNRERAYKFKPDAVPPKTQMFYQLCDIHTPEVHELLGVLTVRFNLETPPCNPKYGYLDADIMEYCRYCISHCIEARLFKLGKIDKINLPAIRLDSGGTIPISKLWSAPRVPKKSVKRISSAATKTKKATGEADSMADVSENTQDSTGTSMLTLTDYFEDDDEEMEEEDIEPYETLPSTSTGATALESYFYDDEPEESNDSDDDNNDQQNVAYVVKELTQAEF